MEFPALVGMAALMGSHEQIIASIERAIENYRKDPSEKNRKAINSMCILFVVKEIIQDDPSKLSDFISKMERGMQIKNILEGLN